MKGIYFKDNKVTCCKDLPIPIPSENESLIKISYAAICNTDKEILRGYRPDFRGIMGHEFVGVVQESPNHELIGKKVVGELNASCGECIYCKTGRSSHCNQRKIGRAHV